MQKEYPIRDLARIFPDMPPEDFARLVASIREDGLMDPITVWQGRVIDGRHRYAACAEAGVERRFGYLDDDADPLRYILATFGHSGCQTNRYFPTYGCSTSTLRAFALAWGWSAQKSPSNPSSAWTQPMSALISNSTHSAVARPAKIADISVNQGFVIGMARLWSREAAISQEVSPLHGAAECLPLFLEQTTWRWEGGPRGRNTQRRWSRHWH